jgi:putative intracellular protease/amidase
MKILMVLTSHDVLGNTGLKTGFWLEEFAAPYFVFRNAGVQLTLASPKGGQPPLDPKSDLPESQTLWGQDYGGPVGFRMILAHPERVPGRDSE